MAESFNITVETERGARAAAAWLEANPDHPGIPALAEKAALPFEECYPSVVAAGLQLTAADFKRWWRAHGSEQQPSHSWTSGFLREIARQRYTPPLASPRARLSARGFAEDDDGEPAK
jgi:hypothetical protein